MQSGKKCEIPAGAIPLLTADIAAAAHLPDGQGIPTITLQVIVNSVHAWIWLQRRVGVH